jgi:hypothetical protein
MFVLGQNELVSTLVDSRIMGPQKEGWSQHIGLRHEVPSLPKGLPEVWV